MPGGKARSTERRTPGGNDDSVPLLAKKVKVLEEGTMAVKKGAKLFGMTTYRVRILALLLVAAAGLSNNWVMGGRRFMSEFNVTASSHNVLKSMMRSSLWGTRQVHAGDESFVVFRVQ
eukprot:1392477-Amorphochlora_amoeboformis.AAC.1